MRKKKLADGSLFGKKASPPTPLVSLTTAALKLSRKRRVKSAVRTKLQSY